MAGQVDSYETKTQGRRWRIQYDLPPDPATGDRRRTTRRGFKTKREAEAALIEALGSVAQGTHVDHSTATLAEYLRAWLAGAQVRPTTKARYRQSIEAHLLPHLGSIRLQSLTAENLDACYQELLKSGGRREEGLAPKTIRNAHGTLHKALKDAVERGYVVRNVTSYARPPRVERPDMEVWAPEQLRRFLARVAEDRLYPLWLLYATTGLRRGEALGLRWTDLDLDCGRLSVSRPVTVVDGRAIVSEPKTAKGRRLIALDKVTTGALREHRARQARERLAAGPEWEDTGLVFCWEDGSLIHPRNPTRWIRELAEELGLPHIKLHGLRHSYATAALNAGVDVKVLSERLGHANTSITRELYQHVSPENDEAAAETAARSILGPER